MAVRRTGTTESLPKITAWSFSRWNDYCRCPFLAKCKYVLKLKEPDNKYMARGSQIHKLAEDFALGKLKQLPPELAAFPDEFKKLRGLKPAIELQWAFTQTWQTTSWFGDDAWCRIKLDATVVKNGKRFVIDHKTGKVREEHAEQLELYAMGSFLVFPEDEVEAQDWYLDLKKDDPNKIGGADFTRDQLPSLQKDWERRVKPMLNDAIFLPKPNDMCRFCHFRKENSGPCKY